MNNVAHSVRPRAQFDALILQDHDRMEAGRIVRAAFPDRIKQLGRGKDSVYRWRSNSECNPLFRIRQIARIARQAGMPRSAMQMFIVDLEAHTDSLWSDSPACDDSIRSLNREEQEWNAVEDIAQFDLQESITPDRLRAAIVALEGDVARTQALLAILRRRMEQ